MTVELHPQSVLAAISTFCASRRARGPSGSAGRGPSRVVRSSLVFGLGAWMGCDPGVFLCDDDLDCGGTGLPGVCQVSGYCSFDDPDCESGQRYGEHAGGELGGACVGVEDSNGPEPEPQRDGDGDDPTEPPGDAPDARPGFTTNGVECRFDDFDDGQLDGMWCSDLPPGFTLVEEGELLEVGLHPEQWSGGEQTGQLRNCEELPLLGMEVTVHIGAMPSARFAEGFFEVGNSMARIGVSVWDSEIAAYAYDGPDYWYLQDRPFDPQAHQYWRIRGTEDGLVAEVSADAEQWVHLYTYALDLSGESGEARFGVWREDAPSQGDSAELDWIEVCSAAR